MGFLRFSNLVGDGRRNVPPSGLNSRVYDRVQSRIHGRHPRYGRPSSPALIGQNFRIIDLCTTCTNTVKMPCDWAEGSYSQAEKKEEKNELKATIIEQHDQYSQDSINRSFDSMPRRLAAAITKKGFILDHSDCHVHA